MAKRACYLTIACDSDPDENLPWHSPPPDEDPDRRWRGLVWGVGELRRALGATDFVRRHGQPPITWLIRSDRQILEAYGDAAWCFHRFQRVWSSEGEHRSELGWHPHLYKWDDTRLAWHSWLHRDDDLDTLGQCLAALRACTEIKAVRTGWDYHSNRMMALFARSGLTDASPVPGSVQISVGWQHDWAGTPRDPYQPAASDYRRPATKGEAALPIWVLPTLVRRLPLLPHAARYAIRRWRGRRSGQSPSWRSAAWQGQFISRMRASFVAAVRQRFEELDDSHPTAHLVTYFHPDEILPRHGIYTFLANLQTIAEMAQQRGYELIPTTVTAAAKALSSTSPAGAGATR